MTMNKREFPNLYRDFEGQKLLDSHGKLAESFAKKIRHEVKRLLKRLQQGLESGDVDASDYTVYTGSTGISILYMLIDDVMTHDTNSEDLHEALAQIERPLRHLKRRRVTFLCGDAGPLAVGAVLYYRLGRKDKSSDCIKRLLSRQRDVCDDDNLPDEVLFGRAGYLFSLLYVQQHLGQDAIDADNIEEVYKQILISGQTLSQAQKSRCPLMYEWHGKKYLGAAHGLAGIFYILMLVKDPRIKKSLEDLVRPSIDFLMNLRYPSGNYPSSTGSSSGDKLVHWCHGAPGWIYMFIQAYKTFGDKKYLDEAKCCGEVLWSRGLLHKGYGICHGVAGNAYGFLALYRVTGEDMYLHRACKFAEWCFDYGKHGCRTADRPFSLFEGLAGTIHFLVDLLDPKHSRFPAYEL